MSLRQRFDSFLKGLSLRAGLVAMLVGASIVPTAFVHLLHARRIEKIVSTDMVSYGRQIVERTAAELNLLISHVEIARTEVLGLLVLSRTFAPGAPPPGAMRQQQLDRMSMQLKMLTWSFPSFAALYVVNWDHQVYSSYPSGLSTQYYSSEELLRQPWIADIAARPLSEVVTTPHVPAYVFPDTSKLRRVVSFAKHMNTFSRLGLNTIIQVDVDYESIAAVLKGVDLGSDGFLLVSDRDGNIVVHADESLVGKHIGAVGLSDKLIRAGGGHGSGRSREVVVASSLGGTDWQLVGVIPTGRLAAEYRQFRLASNLLVLLVGMVSVIGALFLSDLVASPIRRLVQVTRKVGEGDILVPLPDPANRDFAALSDSVGAIAREIDDLTKKIAASEADRREAESRVRALFGRLAKAQAEVVSLTSGQREASELRSRVRKYERLLAVAEPSSDRGPAVSDARIQKAVDYLWLRYNDPGLSLAEIAEHVSLDPTYFSTKFKRVVGRGFADYLIDLRMQRAKRLLVTPQLRVREVAEMVGYRDVHYFSRIFRKREGVRPTEYRAALRSSGR